MLKADIDGKFPLIVTFATRPNGNNNHKPLPVYGLE